MKIIKNRVPPFAVGLVIGTILSFFLLTAWWKAKKSNPGIVSTSAVHHILASADSWLNSDRALIKEDLAGRVLLLHFWSRACLECRDSAKVIAEIEEQYRGRLSVVGIFSPKLDAEKESESISSLLHRRGQREITAVDKDFRLWREFSVRDWPTTMIIDPLGHIFARYPGKLDPTKMRGDLERLYSTFPKPRVEPKLPQRFFVGPESEVVSPLRFPTKISGGKDDLLWVTDTGNNRVLGFNSSSGKVIHIVGGQAPGFNDGNFSSARFREPTGIVVHNSMVYVADTGNHSIRRIDLVRRQVTRVAGTGRRDLRSDFQRGKALEVSMDTPTDLALAPKGESIYIAMAGAHQVWSFDPKRAELNRVWGNGKDRAEDGPDPITAFMQPAGMLSFGKDFYIVDAIANSLRRVGKDGVFRTLVGGELTSFGFSDGGSDRATMQGPESIAASEGGVVIADSLNHALRFYDTDKRFLSTILGGVGPGHADGSFAKGRLFQPTGLYNQAGKIFVADSGNHAIRIANRRSRSLTTLNLKSEPTEISMPDFERFPPQVEPEKTIAARESFSVCIVSPDGWNLAALSPSWIALARRKGDHQAEVNLSNLEILSILDQKKLALGEVSLPPLEEGAVYSLLASLYICRGEGEEAECAYNNIRLPLKAVAGLGKPAKCSIKISP